MRRERWCGLNLWNWLFMVFGAALIFNHFMLKPTGHDLASWLRR
jgi:hypothetical protein